MPESEPTGRPTPRKGRGSSTNPDPRYAAWARSAEDDGWGNLTDESAPVATGLFVDTSRSIIVRNQSPDVPFSLSINPYRGCEHGCAYCFARPTHAYLGLSPGLDFETRIAYKPDAADLLRHELNSPAYVCEAIALGVNTDAYQPVERRLGITRSILELFAEFRQPVVIITKSALVLRDLDILAELATLGLAQVVVSVTTLDRELSRRMEPRAAAPDRRLEVIQALAAAGIPAGVLVAPVIPALNDHDLERIVARAHQCGASSAAYILLRLPLEVKDLFYGWLAAHYPDKAEHVASLMRQTHGGRDYDSRFGVRMRGTGEFAKLIEQRFELACRRVGLNKARAPLDTGKFKRPIAPSQQLDLF